MLKKKRGQSTIEYIILVTGVIVALIFFLKPKGPFSTQFNQALRSGSDGMLNMAKRLNATH